MNLATSRSGIQRLRGTRHTKSPQLTLTHDAAHRQQSQRPRLPHHSEAKERRPRHRRQPDAADTRATTDMQSQPQDGASALHGNTHGSDNKTRAVAFLPLPPNFSLSGFFFRVSLMTPFRLRLIQRQVGIF